MCEDLLVIGFPGVQTLRLVHTEPSAFHQLWSGFPTPSIGSWESFSSSVSTPEDYYSLYLPASLSNLGGSGLLSVVTSLVDIRIVDFSICSALAL